MGKRGFGKISHFVITLNHLKIFKVIFTFPTSMGEYQVLRFQAAKGKGVKPSSAASLEQNQAKTATPIASSIHPLRFLDGLENPHDLEDVLDVSFFVHLKKTKCTSNTRHSLPHQSSPAK